MTIEKELEDTKEALCRSRQLYEWEKELNNRLSKRDFSKVTRVEVIDKNWRVYVNRDTNTISISIQDDGRTIKLFLR